jgi:hypothetical protein
MANEWNITYPINHTEIGDGPLEIRKLKTSTKTQIDREHETPVDGDATGGEHSNGSAVTYVGSDAPTKRPDGSTALGDNDIDNGRLWIDDTESPGRLKRWKGDGFEDVVTGFGAWADKDSDANTLVENEVYKAEADGFVLASIGTTSSEEIFRGCTGSSNPPTTACIITKTTTAGPNGCAGITLPVRRDDFWEISYDGSGTVDIHWLPIGSGECVKQ